MTAGWRLDGDRWIDLDGVAMSLDEALERHRRDVERGNLTACQAVTNRDAVGPQNATGGGRR